MHTGGTTGAPKIAAHTHASQLACGRGIASSGLAPGEGMLGGLPLFHVNALIVTGIAPMFSGTRVVWPGPSGYRDPALYARFWQIVEHYRIFPPPPPSIRPLAQIPSTPAFSSLRLPIVGAAPLPVIGTRSLRRAHRAAAAGRLWADRGDLRQHLDQAGRGTARVGRPGPPGQQIKAVRIGARAVGRLRPRRDRRTGDRRARRVRRVRR